MNWYYVMNGQQVGPLSEEDFEGAIRSGAITPATLVWREGLPEWQPLQVARPGTPAEGGTCAGCGKWFGPQDLVHLGGASVCAACKPAYVQRLKEGAPLVATQQGNVTEDEILTRDFRVDIGESLTRAWRLFSDNKQAFLLGTLLIAAVYIGLAIVSGLLNAVTFVGGSILSQVLGAPLAAGFLWYFLRMGRGESLPVTDVLAGFRRQFGQLILNALVQGVIMGLCFIPLIIGVVVMAVMASKSGSADGFTAAMAGSIGVMVVLGAVSLVAVVYLATLWTFSELLIIDKGYQFWPAMQLSRKLVRRRWWMTFGFVFVAGVIMTVGMLACGVGLLVSVPVGFAMRAYLFEDNFRDLVPRG